MDRLDVYTPITKREKDPATGHLYVYGKMTGPDLDNDHQRMDGAWLKTAVPEWARVGNIREMHQAKAVGKAVEIAEKDDGWYLGAKIIDKDTIEKIENDVLTGFSIGIKFPRIIQRADAPNGAITGGRICETSVVDSPCLPSALFTIAKADSAGDLQPVEDPTLVVKSSAEHIAEALELLTERHSVTKADDENGDITGARAAIAAILPLIQSEIDGLTAGNLAERWDISDLTTALSALTSFLASEVAESQEEPMDAATKTEIAELVKAEVKSELAEQLAAQSTSMVETLTKALKPEPLEGAAAELTEGPDIAKMVGDAVTAAMEPFSTGLACLTTKVDGIPVGGGPAITRTAGDVGPNSDAASEKQRLLAKAENPAINPLLRDEYRRQAAALTV
jgi:hypothetical protein